MENNSLQHYGVKGMKWGHRKRQEPTSDIRSRYDAAKSTYKTANKEYERAYTKASMYSTYHPISQYISKKRKAESNKRWEDAANKVKTAYDARLAYKDVKRERKQAIKDSYKNIQKNSSFGEKMFYSDGTRKLAAKYVVDNNMSVSDAKKKANDVAIKNTAAILAVYGGIAVGYYMNNR